MAERNLDRRDFHKLTTAALGGLAAGAILGCNKPGGGAGGTTPVGDVAIAKADIHLCRGLNECKGHGKGGENACRGQGACATAKEHGCGGQNECKGLGGCGDNVGANDCKGEGGCHVPLMTEPAGESAWDKLRKKKEAEWAEKKLEAARRRQRKRRRSGVGSQVSGIGVKTMDMMLRRLLALGIVVQLGLAATIGTAGEPVKSGLQAGEKVTTIFEPVNVTGEHAGEPYCLICENGLAPVAMLFARDVNEPLLKLLGKLDEATAKHRDQEMGSFVVFLNESDELRKQLASEAKKRGLKRIVLSTFEPAGPEGFGVAADADLTVVLYREHEVKANHAFRRGELTDTASEKILADLPKILTK